MTNLVTKCYNTNIFIFAFNIFLKTRCMTRYMLSFRGSLLTRNLGDLVKKEYFVLDSEYLTTLVVCVPR